jgi:hypothetical protein
MPIRVPALMDPNLKTDDSAFSLRANYGIAPKCTFAVSSSAHNFDLVESSLVIALTMCATAFLMLIRDYRPETQNIA